MQSVTSKFILGSAQFGMGYGINNRRGRIPPWEAFGILDRARELGVRSIDTAEGYGCAHDILGLYNHLYGSDLNIYTKFKLAEVKDESLEQHLKNSLHELCTEQVECYSFHSYEEFISVEDFEPYVRLKTQGLTRKLGVSVYYPHEAMRAANTSWIDVIQIPFNLLDNVGRWSEFLLRAKELGKIVHSRSAFLQGLFFKPLTAFDNELRHLTSLKPTLGALHDISTQESLSLWQTAIYYPFQTPDIHGVIVGVDGLDHFQDNMRALTDMKALNSYSQIGDIQIDNLDLINPARWEALKARSL